MPRVCPSGAGSSLWSSLTPRSVADVFAISTGYGLTGQSPKPDPLSVVFSGIASSKGILEGTTPAPVIMIAEIEAGVSPSYKSASMRSPSSLIRQPRSAPCPSRSSTSPA